MRGSGEDEARSSLLVELVEGERTLVKPDSPVNAVAAESLSKGRRGDHASASAQKKSEGSHARRNGTYSLSLPLPLASSETLNVSLAPSELLSSLEALSLLKYSHTLVGQQIPTRTM